MTEKKALIFVPVFAHQIAVMEYDDVSEMLTNKMFEEYRDSEIGTGNLHFEFSGYVEETKQAIISAWLQDDTKEV